MACKRSRDSGATPRRQERHRPAPRDHRRPRVERLRLRQGIGRLVPLLVLFVDLGQAELRPERAGVLAEQLSRAWRRPRRLAGALLGRRQQDRRIHEAPVDSRRRGASSGTALSNTPVADTAGRAEIESDVEPVSAGLLERGDRAGGIGGRILARPHGKRRSAELRVDRAEDAVRLLIGGVPRQGRLGVRDGVDGVVLTRVEAGELGPQFGGAGVERDGALVGLDGFVDACPALSRCRPSRK